MGGARVYVLLVLYVLLSHAIRTSREDEGSEDLGVGDFPPLCDDEIVSQTCKNLNGNGTSISKELIAQSLSKSTQQMQSLWQTLVLPVGDPVNCLDLCNALTSYISDWHILPPRSDLACYTVGSRWFCDADVRPAELKHAGLRQDDDMPDLHGVEDALAMSGSAHSREPEQAAVTPWQLIERVANLFRVFPAEKAAEEETETPIDMDLLRTARKSGEIAEAFLGAALREFEQNQTGPQMRTWFGSVDSMAERNIRLTLNSASDLLSKAIYLYPGPQCTKNRYAYVHPDGLECSRLQLHAVGPRCATHQGHAVLYLCKAFFSRPRQQVLTLIHEASHHATAFTEDVCADPDKAPEEPDCATKAYGRANCSLLADKLPSRALLNADNYCYYVQDIISQNSLSPWTQVARPAHDLSETFTCPALSEPRGSYCKCVGNGRCFQGVGDGCQLASSTSSQYFLPGCTDCQCASCPVNAQLLAGGTCECNEEFQCSSAGGNGCHQDSRSFSITSCPECKCERLQRTTKSKWKEHRQCTEPCGSMVQGQRLEADKCARCVGATCYLQNCTEDACFETQCGDFSYCKAWSGQASCRCFAGYRDGPSGCRPVIVDHRCCYTDLTHPLARAVWVPRALQDLGWLFKRVCPTVNGVKWHHAPESECTGLIYKHPENYRLNLGFEI